MDKLKEYIKNNRNQLDDMEPADGHLERFAARLNTHKKQPKRLVRILAAATLGAAAAILVTLLILPLNQTVDNKCSLSPELAEVSSYYAIQVEQEIDRIQQLVVYADGETRNELLADIMLMREESDKFLNQICDSHMDESDSIPIIIRHYQSHIDALQTTANILESNIANV